MKKRKIMMMFIIFISIFTLMGCNSKKESSEGVNRKLRGKINIAVDKQRINYINTYVNEFNKMYPNVKIDVKEDNNIYKPQDDISKESMDMIVVKNEYTQYFLNNFTKNFLDISDNISPYKGNFSKGELGNVSFNNKIYGIPLDRNPYVMIYRKDIFDKCKINIDDIRTWDDYIDAGKIINKTLKGNYKFLWEEDKSYLYKILLSQLGENYTDKNGDWTMDSHNSTKALEMIKKIRDENFILGKNSNATLLEEIKKGKLAATICSINDINLIMSKLPEMKDKLLVGKIPGFELGGNRDVSMNGYNMLVLNNGKNKETVSAFLQFMLKDEKLQLELFLNKGVFPANLNIYKAEEFNKNVEYFNDKIWLLASNIQKQAPDIIYPVNFPEIEKVIKKSFH
ncbi:putative arabinose-binding protein precursor [Clostridium liquoris]|jgi:ABC-type glycerol-3-phosphate transport system substrate-binding protein|uniref:Putative arabinose-binding protein n=1 Tax=Clostridium liquoris TaxID=1289519 RepID=A0A2T0B473_9CLOT|nr:ABC transporter substrate-binding protein [Clostridium liquoris]PRR78662.1 putative arabinose-binding protein precursor [Clostridium liquoris]